MLEWMQKHRKYLVVTVWISALALIFASMVEWGGGGFTAGSRDSIARVGDVAVSSQEYQKAYYDIYNILKQMIGEDNESAIIPEIEQEAFRQLIREKLFEVLAKDMNVTVTPEEILEKILTVPEFRNQAQVFDKQIYLDLLAANNMRPDEYEAFVSKTILLEKIQNFPIFPLSTLEMNSFLGTISVQDDINVRILNKKDILAGWKPDLDEDKIQAYWKSNKEKYFSPARYRVAYIALNTEDVQPTQDKLRKFYEDNVSHYKGSSFENIQEDLKQDYRKAILRFASSYMSNASRGISFQEDMANQDIKEINKDSIAILENNLDTGDAIEINAIPVSFVEIYENDMNMNFTILSEVMKGDGLLSPFEYISGKWFIPYIVEKVQQQTLDFVQAKERAQGDLVTQLENDEFRRLVLLENSDKEKKMRAVGFINMSDWHAKDTQSYKVLAKLGLHDNDIRELIQQVMNSDKLRNVAFLNSDKAVLYEIVQQQMPSYSELTHVTNEDVNALEEAKIRDLRSALIEYATDHYKIIDYRRQK